MSGRGGTRVGAGRKRLDADSDTLIFKISLLVDEESYEYIKDLGEGNVSLGARRAIALLRAPRAHALQSVSKPLPERGAAAVTGGGVTAAGLTPMERAELMIAENARKRALRRG